MSAVLLLSGGVESSVLLAMESPTVVPVFIDYAQRASKREYAAAQAQCESHGLVLRRLDLSQVGNSIRATQNHKLHVPLPHRNLVALAVGLSYATALGARRLLLALNREDQETYPSAAGEFISGFRALAAELGEVRLETPIAHLGKAQIVAEGARLKIDFAQTWSCLLGYAMPCQRCTQCRNRAAAFAAARITDTRLPADQTGSGPPP